MKAAVGPILTGVFAVLGLFGVNFSEDVRAVIHDNLAAVVSAIIVLLGLMPSIVDAFKKKPAGPDEHQDAFNQKGAARIGLLVIGGLMALSVAIATSGCASFGPGAGKLSPDQRAAAVLLDSKAVAETCGRAYEADLINEADVMICAMAVGEAIDAAQTAHLLIVAGDGTPEEASEIEKNLAHAEQIIVAVQKALAKVQAANKPVSTQVWHGVAPLNGVGV